MADEIKLSNSGRSNLRPDALTGQIETGDALVAIFSDFWQSEASRISDQHHSKNANVSGNESAAIIENNDIKTSDITTDIATIERLPEPENDDTKAKSMEDVIQHGKLSEISKIFQNYLFFPTEAAAKTVNSIQVVDIPNTGNLIAEYVNNPNKIQNLPNEAAMPNDGSLKLEPMSLYHKAEIVSSNASEFLPLYDFVNDRAAPSHEEAGERNLTDISVEFSWHAASDPADNIVISTFEELKVNNYRIDYQNLDLSKPSSDFFSYQNIGMTVDRAVIAKPIDDTQILFDAPNQSGIFKSIIASDDIHANPHMAQVSLRNSASHMKNNTFLEFISYGEELGETRYLDISRLETSPTIIPKLKTTEPNSYANLEHPPQILLDGKTEKAIAPALGVYVAKGADITVSDNKNKHTNVQSKVIRVDMLKKTWEQQIVSKLVSGIKENAPSIDLILQPKKLGEVSVQIVRDANNVSIKLTSESENIANLFKATEIQLETLLAQNGMKLAGFTVRYDNQGRDNRNSQQSNNSKNGMLLKKKSEKSVQNDLKTESVATRRHVGDYDYLV